MLFSSSSNDSPSYFLQALSLMLVYLCLTGQANISIWVAFLPVVLPHIVVIVGGTLLFLYRKATGYDFKAAREEKEQEFTIETTEDLNAFVAKVINAGNADIGGPTKDEKLSKWFRK